MHYVHMNIVRNIDVKTPSGCNDTFLTRENAETGGQVILYSGIVPPQNVFLLRNNFTLFVRWEKRESIPKRSTRYGATPRIVFIYRI